MKNKNIIIGVIVILGIISLIVMAFAFSGNMSKSNNKKVVLYKSPTCGCCVEYSAYLEQNGYEVETIVKNDMSTIKNQYGIPRDKESCHTMVVDGYTVEGHVPVELVNQLLDERPNIDGIGLAGMPAGSPGMPGTKREAFDIYSLQDGVADSYIKY